MYNRILTLTLVLQLPAKIKPEKVMYRTKIAFFSLKEQYFLTMINYEKVDLETFYYKNPIRFEKSLSVKEILMSEFDQNFGHVSKIFSDNNY